MTARERTVFDRFIKHVNRKLDRIEANIRFSQSLHEFEVTQLKAKLAKATRRRRR